MSETNKDGQGQAQDEKGCCATKKCCGKTLAALALLAVGGLGGYAAAKCCGAKDAPAAVSQAK